MSAIQEMKPFANAKSLHQSHVSPEPRPSDGDHDVRLQRPTKNYSGKAILGIFAFSAAGFAGLFLLGWMPRQHLAAELEASAQRIRTALPTVRVAKPRLSAAISSVTLPGDVQAMEEITIYPRTTGYLKRWLVDIGDEVQEGQLLAEIDTPEVKAQFLQSKAALAESRANLERAKAAEKLAIINVNRARGLVEKQAVAQQQLDDAQNALEVAVANVKLSEATIESNEASVQHIQELLSFCEIRASFAGTVTARHVDTGKLMTSGNGTGQAIFQIARTSPVRVFVNVPQNFAPGVSDGLKAEIIAREIPGRLFEGFVTRTARAIDPVTRTLLTEVQVPNEDHALLTGSYVQVRMDVSRQHPTLIIPSAALIFNSDGNQVAVVGPDQQIQLRSVRVAEDFGSEIGISTGITAEDDVVINPGDRMSNALKVEVSQETKDKSKKTDAKTAKH